MLRPDGTIAAAGHTLGYSLDLISLWDGTNWTLVGAGIDGSVNAITNLPSGDLVAAGTFTTVDGIAAANIARWNGSTWQNLGLGVDSTASALAVLTNGELLVGGAFRLAGNGVSSRLAILATSCPATATIAGSGCPSSLGQTPLLATQLPWTGSPCALLANNLPPGALTLGLLGFAAQSLPLASLHPAAGPQCTLQTSGESVVLLPATNAQVGWSFPIPSDPSVVGLQLHAQLLVGEFAASGLQTLSNSNALTLTIGSF